MSFPAILLTGARQTGKSTLFSKFVGKAKIDSLTLDNPLLEMFARDDPVAFFELHRPPLLIDEVQYVPELFRYIKMEIDKKRTNGSFFLTGSQPFLLMQKSSESLAGRIGIFELYPLSSREIRGERFSEAFLPSDAFLKKRQQDLRNFPFSVKATWEAIAKGGYPEVVTGKVTKDDFYSNYVKTYIERDIKKIIHVADETQFLRFISVVASRTAQLVNFADLARDCALSEFVVKKWLSLLISSGLVYSLPPYSTNVEKRVIKTPKLYFMDVGLAAYLTRWTNAEVMREGSMAEAFFETYVISEIVKSFANRGERPPLYFYRDKDKTEIDLLIENNGTLYPVEIKKTATPSANDTRNFFILDRIKNVQISKPVIVCNCATVTLVKKNEKGAICIPVEFL